MSTSNGLVDILEFRNGEVFILKLRGRLDALSSPAAEKRLFDLIKNGENKLLLNFDQVEYISSAGMRMLLSAAKKLKTLSGKLILCNVTGDVMDVLKMSGFDHVLELAKTEGDAIRKF